MTDEEKFWSKVNKGLDHECWEWTDSIGDRYGKIWIDNKWISAHRFSYMLSRRCEIPKGMQVLHLCDNTKCVNPSHLYCGTQADNMKDRFERGRVDQAMFAQPKFYCGEVWLMKKLYKDGLTQTFIAKMFKTDQSTISRWVRDEFRVCKPIT